VLLADGQQQVLGASERYRDIFNAAADAMALRDEKFRIVDVNPAFVAQTGFSREEALGKDYVLGGAVEPDATILARHRRALAGEPAVVETVRLRKDSTQIDVELRCIPIQHQGRPHVLYVARDVSDRKRTEEALRASEEQYRSIFNAAQDWMVLRDAEFRVVDINAAYLAVIGCTREEVLGRDSVLGHDADELDRLLKSRHAGVLAGEPMVVETQRTREDGRRIDLELRGVPVQYCGKPHVLYIGRDISERKRTEEALRVSEEQYRSIFNASQDTMVLRDAHFRIVDVNAAWVAVTGFSREQALGQERVLGADPPEFEQYLRAQHHKVLAGESMMLETERVRMNGRREERELRAVPVLHQGKPHVLYIGRDIGERKRAEEALRASEEQYRGIFHASADGMILRDADFRVVDVNPAYERMSGYSREEVLGKDRLIANPPELNDVIRELHRRALAGEPVHLETQSINKNGSRFELEVRGVQMQYRGTPHVLYVGRDISARKRTEEALRASEEQYRSIFNATSDALVLRDADARVVDVNPAFLAMSGYSRDEVVNETRWFFAGAEMSGLAKQMHSRVIAGEPVHFEVRGVRKDGSPLEVEMHAVPMRYRGQPHALGMARDITARKRADAERAQLEAQLRQAQKMEAIGHLAGGIAHDFNNILTSIQGYAQLAAERPAAAADAKLSSHLDHLELACNRARELIQQMLVFSRGRRGAARALALAPLVRQTIRLLRSSLPATLEIVPEFAPDLPAALLDPVQTEQVLMNLCINAHDATHGRGTVQVAVTQQAVHGVICSSCRGVVTGNFVQLAVADEGPGISAEVMDRMFEPFFSTKDTGRGTGMGLAIVHGIVHEHGGHILVESTSTGARFRVLFPAAAGTQAVEIAPRRRAAAPASPLKGRVLLVDDEQMVARFMRELLQGWGLKVTAVTSATDAKQVFTRAPQDFDVLLTDYTMPRMTGLDLAQALRAVRPGLPVIVYSGYTDVIPEADLGAPPVEVVQKPIDQDALLVALTKHL
jgi:PAS domain S-box-containing protein